MKKEFKKIIAANSNEISLCSKYNSGANKQVQFEIVKDKESEPVDIKPVLKKMVKMSEFYLDELEEKDEVTPISEFKDFIEYWLIYDVDNCFYNLLSEALRSGMSHIQYEDKDKEDKLLEYQELFTLFLQEYMAMPITKNKEGKYTVSLVSNSLIKEDDTNPQSETQDITKEKSSTMIKTEEEKTTIQKAFEVLTSAFGLAKTETPAEPTPEKTEVEQEAVKPAEETAEVEAPIVEKAEVEEKPVEKEVKPVEDAKEEVEPIEESTEAPEPAEIAKSSEPVEKTESVEELVKQKVDLEAELAEMKKAKEEKEVEIAKMSYIQKAKDEYSMLAGTPEEIGQHLYTISKSNLEETSKTFIMDQLKRVSDKNESLTKEVGSMTKSADNDMTDEEKIYAEAEQLAKTKNISINKALRQLNK